MLKKKRAKPSNLADIERDTLFMDEFNAQFASLLSDLLRHVAVQDLNKGWQLAMLENLAEYSDCPDSFDIDCEYARVLTSAVEDYTGFTLLPNCAKVAAILWAGARVSELRNHEQTENRNKLADWLTVVASDAALTHRITSKTHEFLSIVAYVARWQNKTDIAELVAALVSDNNERLTT